MAEACKLTGGSGGGKGLEMALGTSIKGSLQGRIILAFNWIVGKYDF